MWQRRHALATANAGGDETLSLPLLTVSTRPPLPLPAAAADPTVSLPLPTVAARPRLPPRGRPVNAGAAEVTLRPSEAAQLAEQLWGNLRESRALGAHPPAAASMAGSTEGGGIRSAAEQPPRRLMFELVADGSGSGEPAAAAKNLRLGRMCRAICGQLVPLPHHAPFCNRVTAALLAMLNLLLVFQSVPACSCPFPPLRAPQISGEALPPKDALAAEREALLRAEAQGVVYVVGRSALKAGPGSSWLKASHRHRIAPSPAGTAACKGCTGTPCVGRWERGCKAHPANGQGLCALLSWR